MKKTLFQVAFASLLASSAFAQWSSDPMTNLGVAIRPNAQVQPKIHAMGNGGSYISWFDNNPHGNPPFGYDVYLQRLSERGVPQLRGKGIRIADLGMSSTQDYGLDVDADGNALLAFLDDRFGPDIVVTAMKVSPRGERLWGLGGRQVGTGSDFRGNPKVAATSDGFVVVGFIDNSDLIFQKFDSAGNAIWGTDGIKITAPSGLTYGLADLHGSDGGSVIFSFVSSAGFTGPKHLLANKLSPTGELLWGASHVTVFDGGSLQFGNFPPFIADGAGGAVFGWYQVSPLQSLAQHILSDGSEAFPHNGTAGSIDTSHNQVNPAVSYDPESDVTYLAWNEQLPGPVTNEGISAQKFDAVGARQWGDTGVVVQGFTNAAVLNVTSVFTAAGPLVVWSSEAVFAQDTIMGAKLDPSGALICPPFAVSSILSSKSRLNLTLSTSGLALATWSDGRNDEGDIFAQDIKEDCSLGL